MEDHDEKVFSSVKPRYHDKKRGTSRRFAADSIRSTANKSGSPMRDQSATTITSLKKGGIESSLVQYDLIDHSRGSSGLLSDVLRTGSMSSDNAAERNFYEVTLE